MVKQRVIILGSSGFIGKALSIFLQSSGTEVIPLSSKELDLTDTDTAIKKLTTIIQPTDAVVFLSVIGPNRGHDSAALIANVKMAEAVGLALKNTPCAQLIYVSSEAVYAPTDEIITIHTAPSPTTSYGVMHLAREIMLRDLLADSVPLLILRVTQVYGSGCTHNAYGPNRFIRIAQAQQKIELFGLGEENRDFIYIDDVIKIISLALKHTSVGITNVATGTSVTYKHLAELVASNFTNIAGAEIKVESKPRAMAITHRFFNVEDLLLAYPGLKFTALKDGISAMRSREFSHD